MCGSQRGGIVAEPAWRPEPVVTAVEVADIRFPTSRDLDGSDAMSPDPDYSVAYVILRTDAPGAAAGTTVEGHGFTFTCGRGTEVVVACIRAMEPLVLGTPLSRLRTDMGGFARSLVADSQLRWLGPEKGVTALATGAIVNAAWDLWAKLEDRPVWELLTGLSPQQVVDLVDFRYIEDFITPAEALALLTAAEAGKAARIAALRERGPKAYTTSAGWLGYTDEKMVRLLGEAIDEGFDHLKLKVGADLEDDVRRCSLARSVIGDDRRLMIDANQVWGVDEAIAWLDRLKQFDLWWVEEPTSPDDILGHATIARAVAPMKVATGEHVHNRVMFKQLLQAGAISICQIDACRVAGVNEVIAILLMAAKGGVVVCPHAGGVGLCELVVHLAAFDAIAVAGDAPDRVVEFVDHLHEHFIEPTVVRDGHYVLPTEPGYTTMHAWSRERFAFPDGPAWTVGENA
jgi:L-fuconate dehydratase